MKPIKNKLYISIKTKLMILIVFLLSLPFVVLLGLWYKESENIIEERTVGLTTPIIEQISGYFDTYIRALEKETLTIAFSPLVRSFVDLDKNNYFDQYHLSHQIRNEITPKLTSGRTDVLAFYIISDNGFVFSSTEDVSIDLIDYNRINNESEKINRNDISFGVHSITIINGTPSLIVIREISYPTFTTRKGLIVIVLKLEHIRSFSELKIGETGFFSIIDWNKKYVFHPEKDMLGAFVNKEIIEYIEDRRKGYFTQSTSDTRKLFIFNKAEYSGSIVVCEVPLRELSGSLENMRDASIMVSIVSIILIILTIGGYSFSIINSLVKLRQLMMQVEKGNLSVKATAKTSDEIGNLNESFNNMVSEIRRLIEVVHESKLKEKEAQIQQKEAYIQALQSQINPHFLYNVLELINSYAIVKGEMPISNMVTCLADMFRYSVNNTAHIVTLREELFHLSIYMQIQKNRYHDLISVSELDDSDLIDITLCTRLTLQPIIENSFIHGYESYKLRPSFIGLHGKKYDNYYEILIEDHGKGISQKNVTFFNKAFEDDEHEKINENALSKSGSIGLLNVHKRLRLTFGKPYGLFILKSDVNGTIMSLKLPVSYDDSNMFGNAT